MSAAEEHPEERPEPPTQAPGPDSPVEDAKQDEWTRRAQEIYENTTSRLRHVTTAAWIRWEDLDPEARAIWTEAVKASDPGPAPVRRKGVLW